MLLNQLFEAITRTGKGDTAVVGWGRGMGHKGHMMLASSVITKAKEMGGDPYFVVSKTVGKDDPITPDEKLAIYKKVFPQSGHIFQPATDEMPDLTRVLTNLNKQGYVNAVVVVGADQVKAFQYLKNYNGKADKSGNVAFNFDTLDVISRQETSDPSAGDEGPRATPMRQVLQDPAKSDEEQFQVWRDAMSPEVSDDEVRDLMTKAKTRMAGFAKPKKESAAEGSYTTEKQILTRIRQIMYDRKLSGTESNAGELLRLKQQLKDLRSQQGVAEANPNQQMSRYNPSGATYKGAKNKMPTLDPQDPVHNADRYDTKYDEPYDPNDKYDQAELQRVMAKQMSTLTDTEKTVIDMRFYDDMTLADVAKKLRVSSGRIRQIEAKALRKLKHPSRSDALQSFLTQGVEEGFVFLSPKEKGNIQNIVSQLSDIPGMWDHAAQTFTDAGMGRLKAALKDNSKYIKYAVNLTADDFDEDIDEAKQRLDPKCWTGYRKQGTKMKGGVRVNNCVKVGEGWEQIISDTVDKLFEGKK